MRWSLVVTLAGFAAAGTASAQTSVNPRPGAPPMRESVRKACENDAQAVCAGKQERELSLCLLHNLQRLSPSCRNALGEPATQRRPASQPPPQPN